MSVEALDLRRPAPVGDPDVCYAPMMAAALWYGRHGKRVIPTAADAPKRPLTAHGCNDATADAEEIALLFRRHPGANVAIAPGPASGCFVLDVDVKSANGLDTLADLEGVNGALPRTPTATTPSGGLHFYFSHPDRPIRNRVAFAPGLDIRAAGGFVVAPPSSSAAGAYAWTIRPTEADFAPPPDWLLDLIDPPAPTATQSTPIRAGSLDKLARYGAAAVDKECGRLAAMAPNTGRNVQLFKSAANLGQLVGAGLLPALMVEGALERAAHDCGLFHDDGRAAVLATIRSGLARGLVNPREVRP